MSVEQFCFRLGKSQIHSNDKKWMPPWLEEYAKGLGLGQAVALPVTEEGVLAFLRSLRDRGVPAWQRLQAARSVEWYRSWCCSVVKLILGALSENWANWRK